MNTSIHSCLSAGVAVMTAATLVIVPSVHEPVPAAPSAPVTAVASHTVALTALTTPTAPAAALTQLPDLIVDWVRRISVPPSADATFPTPQFPPVIGGTSIDSTIKNVYNAVEPWVQWGFELAAYAVGWVPYVGWLAPQIMIFYNFGERIVRSVTFNVADWLGGQTSFVQGLINVGVDTINSFIYLANDELAFWLPPLPPIPPIGPLSATSELADANVTALKAAPEATLATAEPVDQTLDPTVAEYEVSRPVTDPSASTSPVESLTAETTAAKLPTPEVAADVETVETVSVTARMQTSTTTATGNVEAQGEVRAGSQTTDHQAAAAGASPANAKPVDRSADPKPTALEVTATAAETPTTKTEATEDKGDKGKDEKPASSD